MQTLTEFHQQSKEGTNIATKGSQKPAAANLGDFKLVLAKAAVQQLALAKCEQNSSR